MYRCIQQNLLGWGRGEGGSKAAGGGSYWRSFCEHTPREEHSPLLGRYVDYHRRTYNYDVDIGGRARVSQSVQTSRLCVLVRQQQNP